MARAAARAAALARAASFLAFRRWAGVMRFASAVADVLLPTLAASGTPSLRLAAASPATSCHGTGSAGAGSSPSPSPAVKTEVVMRSTAAVVSPATARSTSRT